MSRKKDKMLYWLNQGQMIGVSINARDLQGPCGPYGIELLRQCLESCPAYPTQTPTMFKPISEQRYNNAVLDLRYEEGRWQQ